MTQPGESTEFLDTSVESFPRAVTEEHLAADRDHTPEPVSAYGDDLADNCAKCGLAVTSDGKRHGFDESHHACLPPLPTQNATASAPEPRCACDESDVYDGHAECPAHPDQTDTNDQAGH